MLTQLRPFIGKQITFTRLDGVEATDTIREVFMQQDTLGRRYPAFILTNHSWIPTSAVVEYKPK